MKVLVIGNEQTYGYGLPGGQLSYLGHFIRHISHAGQKVSVDAHTHSTMPELSSALTQLPLNRYDLIILQLDHSLLLSTSTNPSNGQDADTLLSSYTAEAWAQPSFWQKLNVFGSAALSTIWPSYGLKTISKLLKQLRPYRHNVLLLTPLPHRDWLNGWLRKRSRAILLGQADKHVFSVFDLDSVIRPREEYFLANDKGHLSAISHELLGRELFDFYQSAPTIITIQTIRRD